MPRSKKQRNCRQRQAEAALKVLKHAGIVPDDPSIMIKPFMSFFMVMRIKGTSKKKFLVHESWGLGCLCTLDYYARTDSWNDPDINDKYEWQRHLQHVINATPLGCEPALARLVSSWTNLS